MVQLSQLAQVDLLILVGLVHHQDPVGHHFLVDPKVNVTLLKTLKWLIIQLTSTPGFPGAPMGPAPPGGPISPCPPGGPVGPGGP